MTIQEEIKLLEEKARLLREVLDLEERLAGVRQPQLPFPTYPGYPDHFPNPPSPWWEIPRYTGTPPFGYPHTTSDNQVGPCVAEPQTTGGFHLTQEDSYRKV